VAPLRTKVPWAVSALVAYDPTPPEIGDLWDERVNFPLQKVYSLVFILLDKLVISLTLEWGLSQLLFRSFGGFSSLVSAHCKGHMWRSRLTPLP
jgi:hypothetical protein